MIRGHWNRYEREFVPAIEHHGDVSQIKAPFGEVMVTYPGGEDEGGLDVTDFRWDMEMEEYIIRLSHTKEEKLKRHEEYRSYDRRRRLLFFLVGLTIIAGFFIMKLAGVQSGYERCQREMATHPQKFCEAHIESLLVDVNSTQMALGHSLYSLSKFIGNISCS